MLKSYVTSSIKAIIEVPGGYYEAIIEPNDEDGYLAEAPALQCATEGRTIDEALNMLADAVEGWLAVASEKNLKVPRLKLLR